MGALPLIETRNVRGPKDEHGIPMPGSGAASGTFAPKTYQGALSVNDDRNDAGLYLMGHRHYAPDLGRFISRDPIGFAGGLNLCNGAGVSPVTMVDPTGLAKDVLLYFPQSDLDNLNRELGTHLTREAIRANIQLRLRNLTGCRDIDVKLMDYHYPSPGINRIPDDPQGRFRLNLHLADGPAPLAFTQYASANDPDFIDPVGASQLNRARLSIQALKQEAAKGGLSSSTQIENFVQNIISHESIGHGVSGTKNLHSSTGLMESRVNPFLFSITTLDFLHGSGRDIDYYIRKGVKSNLGCP